MAYSNITISTNSGLSFRQYDFIQVTHDSDNYIIGRVVSYNPLNGELIFTPLVVKGSGSFSTWDVTLTGDPGDDGTSGSSGTAGFATSGTSGGSGTAGTSGTTPSILTSGLPHSVLRFNQQGNEIISDANLTFDGHTLSIDPYSYSYGGDPVYRIVYHNDGSSGTAGIVVRGDVFGQPYDGIIENRVPHNYQHQFVVGLSNIAHIDSVGFTAQQALIAENGVYLEALEIEDNPSRFLVWDTSTSGGLFGKIKWSTSGGAGSQGPQGIPGTSGTSGISGSSGEAGTSGTSGETGISGTSGESGTSGTSGEAGTSGTVGSSGSSGSAGTSGSSPGSAVSTIRLFVSAARSNSSTFLFNSVTRTADASASPVYDSAFLITASGLSTIKLYLRQSSGSSNNCRIDILKNSNGSAFSGAVSIANSTQNISSPDTIYVYTFSGLGLLQYDSIHIQVTPGVGGSNVYFGVVTIE